GVGESEGRWISEPSDDGSVHLSQHNRGVTDHYIVDAAFLSSAEARKLHTLALEERDAYAEAGRLVKSAQARSEPEAENADGDEAETRATAPAAGRIIRRPSDLLNAVLDAG